MVNKPVIHPLALQHLRELRERWRVEPTLEEALWIVRLCERVICPSEGERSDLCGFPVRVGISDVWLWPFTVGGSIWWQDRALVWFSCNKEILYHALCFVLAHGRDRVAMREIWSSRSAAEEAVRTWAAGLTCTAEELGAAVDAVLPSNAPVTRVSKPPVEQQQARVDWDRVTGEIEASTGIAADHWVWDVSRDATMRAWSRSRAVLCAMAGAKPPHMDALDRALADLAAAKAAIIEAHKGGAA